MGRAATASADSLLRALLWFCARSCSSRSVRRRTSRSSAPTCDRSRARSVPAGRLTRCHARADSPLACRRPKDCVFAANAAPRANWLVRTSDSKRGATARSARSKAWRHIGGEGIQLSSCSADGRRRARSRPRWRYTSALTPSPRWLPPTSMHSASAGRQADGRTIPSSRV